MDKDLLFTSPKDVSDRLEGCILKYKGRPVYCYASDGMNVYLSELPFKEGTEAIICNGNSKHLNTKTIDVGYVNYRRHCSYILRIPKRQIKAGICSNSLANKMRNMNGYSRIGTLESYGTEIRDAINNVYPSYFDCLKEVKKSKDSSRAFCKDYAVVKTKKPVYDYTTGELLEMKEEFTLDCQGEPIGEFVPSSEFLPIDGFKLYQEHNHSFNIMELSKYGVVLV